MSSAAASSLAPATLSRAAARGERVLIATVNRLEGSTGVHTHTRSLAEGLRAASVGCDIVTPFAGSKIWDTLFAVRPLLLNRLNPTWGTLWYRYWHAAALRVNLVLALRDGLATQIIAQCPPSAQVAMSVREQLGLTDRLPVTMVCHFNGSEADEYRDQGVLKGPAYDRVKAEEQRIIEAVDRVIYVSAWARDLVEQQRHIATHASAVVWNGIAATGEKSGAASRALIGLSASDVMLINVGTLEPRKDQVGLVRLFAAVAGDCPAAKLVLVGDGPHRGLIESTARELGIASRVILLGHRKDVPTLLAMADIYVHFAAAENCPISLIEASRAGLPWAAKAAAGVVELLPALGGVALSGPADAASIAALRELMLSPERRQALGRESRERFVARFTQSAMVDGYLAALGVRPRRGELRGADQGKSR